MGPIDQDNRLRNSVRGKHAAAEDEIVDSCEANKWHHWSRASWYWLKQTEWVEQQGGVVEILGQDWGAQRT
jgi:hypothetical protein